MTRRTAILSVVGLGILAFSSTLFSIFIRNYKKLDLSYLRNKENLIEEIAETILPATESPGAKDAKVHEFVIAMLMECTEVKSQYNFIRGLKNLEDLTQKQFNKDFIACNIEERIHILTAMEHDEKSVSGIVQRIKQKIMGNGFIYMMKYYTVLGYCTSEIGATKGLAYDYIPGSYVACMPLNAHKSWATE